MLWICLIEDNKKLWLLIQESIIDAWYTCDRYPSVESFPIKHTSRYHIFLLDINLPGMDGVTFADMLRQQWPVGIILLTAKDTLQDKKEWFEAWADDYIVKPFATPELLLRIKSLWSRIRETHYFEYKDVFVDRKNNEAKKWDSQVHLTPTEWEVLGYLLRSPGITCVRADIIEHVRWYDAIFSMSRSLDVVIAHLRSKLDKQLINTVSGVGYMIERSHNKTLANDGR